MSNFDEILNKLTAKKDAANKLFAKKKLHEAIEEYNGVIERAKQIEFMEENSQKFAINELLANCYNNISACHKKFVILLYNNKLQAFCVLVLVS